MDLAQRLLDAHTQFQLEQLRGDRLGELIAREVDHALVIASGLTLDDVVTRESIVEVALKYIAVFRLPGAIPEIAGDIALRLRSHPANETPVDAVIARRHVEAMVAKIVEMREVRGRLADQLADNASVQQWLTEFIHGITTEAVRSNRRLAERIPGVASALSLGDRVAGGAVREADKLGRAAAERAARGVLSRWRDSMAQPADDDLVDAVLDVWDDMADRSMAEAQNAIEDDDFVDLIAIGYDFWLEFRESPYLQVLVAVGVDYFFDTYGAFSLTALLEEFGLGREDLVAEAMRFAPRVIAALDAAGELEPIVRRNLGGFYESDAARALLAEA